MSSPHQHEESLTKSQALASEKKNTESTQELSAITRRITELEGELSEARKALYKLMQSEQFKIAEIPPSAQPSATQDSVAPALDNSLQKQILTLTDAMPHMVWISDSEGRTTHANRRFYEFSGRDQDKDEGWDWVQVLHPQDLALAMANGNDAALDNRAFSMEVRCRDKNGDYLWHLLHVIPFYDPDTKSTKWFGTSTSIDDQKQAQEELKQREDELRKLADAIPQIVFVAEFDGEITFWNHRWFEYSGLTRQQSGSDAWQLLIHPEDRDAYMDEWSKSLSTGDTFECEFRMKRAVGKKSKAGTQYLWHLGRAIAYRDEKHEITRWFGTWTEIEGQKRAKSPS
ncbi:MAG: PAS domain-containing protein [Candidatus Obscuribacterales bacterium]|nr:PAS domain-containing protein [Candidatus Obscuribacterales bacterium]